MKRIVKILISSLLCISFLLLINSCDYIDNAKKTSGSKDTTDNDSNYAIPCDCCRRTEDGYTGGLSDRQAYHHEYEMYWLETYDEVLNAVELLKTHGSIITCSLGFNYDSDVIDSKFCFLFKKENAEPLEEGKEFFDRKIDDGEFIWFGFFEDITIDDLVYDTIVYYLDMMYIRNSDTNYKIVDTIEDVSKLSFDWTGKDFHGFENTIESIYELCYEKKCFAVIKCPKTLIPSEYHEEFLNTFVIIE